MTWWLYRSRESFRVFRDREFSLVRVPFLPLYYIYWLGGDVHGIKHSNSIADVFRTRCLDGKEMVLPPDLKECSESRSPRHDYRPD